ncbi:hypothetical protein BLNAU_11610 [Blattamonas nauphoetae]|uniref:Uncharacterized protein n=1 Tax=Blattamonas nauphoetae TaxID=2049346 RepID=A0ABQ9XQI6_9EUKA|nr:hypothetical protein BLNAU_11610 [Blattamonas nauphoetae]
MHRTSSLCGTCSDSFPSSISTTPTLSNQPSPTLAHSPSFAPFQALVMFLHLTEGALCCGRMVIQFSLTQQPSKHDHQFLLFSHSLPTSLRQQSTHISCRDIRTGQSACGK